MTRAVRLRPAALLALSMTIGCNQPTGVDEPMTGLHPGQIEEGPGWGSALGEIRVDEQFIFHHPNIPREEMPIPVVGVGEEVLIVATTWASPNSTPLRPTAARKGVTRVTYADDYLIIEPFDDFTLEPNTGATTSIVKRFHHEIRARFERPGRVRIEVRGVISVATSSSSTEFRPATHTYWLEVVDE